MKYCGLLIDKNSGRRIIDKVSNYLNSKFYLDEYPEQEEIRKEWFEKLNLQKSYRKLLLGCFYSVKDFQNAFKPNKDIYFERRWLRRN